MPLTIKGIKLLDLSVGCSSEDADGKEKITAAYQLLSDKGSVIGARERLTSVPEYQQTVFIPSHETTQLLRKAAASYRRDVEEHLGLVEAAPGKEGA